MFVLSFIILILLFTYFVHKHYSYWKYRGVTFKTPCFPFGNFSFLMRKSVPDFFHELSCKFKCDYVGIFMGWTPTLVIQSPELALRIMVKDNQYFQDRHQYCGYSDPIGAYNLFTLKGPLWKEMRNDLTPVFTPAKLKSVTEWSNLNANELVMKIQRDYIDDKKTVNLKELFSMYVSDSIAFTVFGIRVSALNTGGSPMWQLTSHMARFTFLRGLEFFMILFLPSIAYFLRLKLFSEAGSQYLKKLFWSVVKEREIIGFSDNKDFVNLLIQIKEKYKDRDASNPDFGDDIMLAQAAVFIFAAVDTTSSVLCYCLHELAHHPKEQEKVYQEIADSMTNNKGKTLEYDDLLELKYLTACINETMRRDTVIVQLDRICNEDYRLNDGMVLEKNTPILINVLAIHNDERYYVEPNVWRPERFYDNSNSPLPFFPFGDGRRSCIGKRYGLMQMLAALAPIIYKYRVLPGMPYEVKTDPYSIVRVPINGGIVKFELR